MNLATIDIVILCIYAVGLLALSLWVSRKKKGHEKNIQDYFLASKALPWRAIGGFIDCRQHFRKTDYRHVRLCHRPRNCLRGGQPAAVFLSMHTQLMETR